jgi:predicted ferric reductase
MKVSVAAARPAGLPVAVLLAGLAVFTLAPLVAGRIAAIERASPLEELATGFGMLAGALLLLQALTSGRFEQFSGRIGIDRTMGFHRMVGLTVLALAVLHPLAYAAATAWSDPAAGWARLTGMLSSPRLATGVLALVGLAAIVVLAVLRQPSWIRYEVWRASHGLMAIAVACGALHHALTAGTYAGEPGGRLVWLLLAAFAAVALALVYFVRPWRMWREGWQVSSVAAAGDKSWELTLTGPADTDLRFRPGQFLWLTLSPNRPPFHDHPFSIASAPGELPRLRLLVREAGDCTRSFGAIAPGTPVGIDAAHGSFVLTDEGATVVMIAGGVGVAPLLGMLEDAADRHDARPFRLLLAGRNEGTLPGIDRLTALTARLDLTVHVFLDEGPLQPGTRRGPIDAHAVADAIPEPAQTVAYVCGPPQMMEIVTDILLDRGLAPSAIRFERFDYGAGRGRLDVARRRQAALTLAALVLAAIALAVL